MSTRHTSHRLCPKCGKTEGEFIALFCRDCFLKDNPDLVKVPSKIELERCKRCEKIRVGGRWEEWSDERVEHMLLDKLKVKGVDSPQVRVEWTPHPKSEKEYRVHYTVDGTIDDLPVTFDTNSTLFIRSNICNDDMLISSDYYEGIVQVRFTERTPEKIRAVQDEIIAALTPLQKADSKAVVVNWVLQKHGLDAWIVSSKGAKAAAVAVSRARNGTMSVSGKLIGMDVHSTKSKHRLTFLVRVP